MNASIGNDKAYTLEFVTSLQRLNFSEDIAVFLTEFCQHLGFSHYWYIYADTVDHLRSGNMVSLTNYPDDFAIPYIKYRKYLSGPVFLTNFEASCRPRFWDEIFAGKALSNASLDSIAWAKARGIHNGVLCNLPRSIAEFALLHFAIPKDAMLSTYDKESLVLTLESVQSIIHKKCKDILYSHRVQENKRRLTRRQTECLIWAARGKTSEETALITGLSTHTIQDHLDKAVRNLNAANKVEAVAKAILQGEINQIDFVVDNFH
jgi:DNA-binding CsgD family transcriptional regulator